MDHYGFWSLLPPVLAIFLAIRTKQVFISLLLGIWVGWIIISDWNPLTGTFATIQAMVDVFKDDGNTRTIIFTLLVGSLIAYIQRSGGVDGFIIRLNQFLYYLESKNWGNSKLLVQIMTACTGLIIFVESNISVLTVGALYRPVTDKFKIPREKLAYLADSTSAPSSILIPFNAWGAYIMSILVIQNIDDPFYTLASAFPFNFYPMLAVAMVFYIILSGKDFGPMKKAEHRAQYEGKLIADGATPMMSADVTLMEKVDHAVPKASNMIIPIATMVGMMPIMLVYTGWNNIDPTNVSLFSNILSAIGKGSGSASVLYSVITALLVSSILYLARGIFKGKELVDLTIKGMSGMVTLALLMVMAFAIAGLCKQLGTGNYVAEVSRAWLSPNLVPFIIFSVSCFIAFSTGTSWGTFAIMLSIAVPMAQAFDSNLSLAIAAAIGGGVFGDHCSPISDTSIISSMAAASDHIDHVKTQLPYALVAGGITAFLYLVLGFIL